jgi:hypothetical protein
MWPSCGAKASIPVQTRATPHSILKSAKREAGRYAGEELRGVLREGEREPLN